MVVVVVSECVCDVFVTTVCYHSALLLRSKTLRVLYYTITRGCVFEFGGGGGLIIN